MRAKKLRERINSAATEANQAAQIALQKTAIAMARSDVSPHSRFTGPGYALRSRRGHYIFVLWFLLLSSLCPPCGIGQAIIFLPCGIFVLCSFFLFLLA